MLDRRRGVAGLEALHGLHALAGERVQLTLIAPEDEFVYLKEWLAVSDHEGLTTHVQSNDVPVLTYLARDLSAGQRGNS